MGENVNFTIKALLDESELQEKVPAWENRVRRLNDDVDTLLTKAKRATRSAMSAISATAHTIINVLDLLPGAVNPVFKAILTAVVSTIASLQAIAIAWAAGGVTAPIAIIVESAAIGLSIVGIAAAIMGQQEAMTHLNKVQSVLRSLGTTTRAWGTTYERWIGD